MKSEDLRECPTGAGPGRRRRPSASPFPVMATLECTHMREH